MSMAVGLEVRVPFLEPELMKFAAKIPMKISEFFKDPE